MPENTDPRPPAESPEQADALVSAVRQAIHDLLNVKARLPFLIALGGELRSRASGAELPMLNEAVFRMARDSYDMMVIDLASLREGLTSNTGVLNLLRQHQERFRRSPG